MVEQLVLWASTEERGGITEYLRVMQQTPLWATWDVQHVVTHREGSKLAKFGVFASSVVFFAVNLVRLRPALVHVHAANDASFVRKAVLVWLSSMARVPAILHIHGSGFEDYYAESPRLVRASIRATLRRAKAVVALGQRRATNFRAIAPTARVAVIPNAVEPVDQASQPQPGDPVRVVFLGRIGDRKGAFRLLDAWAELSRSRDPDSPLKKAATLTIAGDGEVEEARERVRGLGITESVEIHEWLSRTEVAKLLDGAQVLVLPSRHEGQPMAVLEAMARGLCVVSSGVGGLLEMVGDGCGVIVDPDDVDAIASALNAVVFDHDLRAQYGAAAYARAKEEFDVGTVWQRLDGLYREVSR